MAATSIEEASDTDCESLPVEAFLRHPAPGHKPKLLDRIRSDMRLRNSSFVRFHHVLNRGGLGVKSPADGLRL